MINSLGLICENAVSLILVVLVCYDLHKGIGNTYV